MFGRKKRTVKEEVAKELSDKLGISEEEALKTLNEIQIKTAIFNSKFIDMLATNEKFINALCKNEKLIDALAKKLDFNLTRRLIIASGIIGGLTLGAGTAGAKLVLTDKFIELDGQKFYPASGGVYDAIVLKDDTYVWAEDRFGKTIAKGEAEVDDADVIQKAIDYTVELQKGKEIYSWGVEKTAPGSTVYISNNVYYINKTIKINYTYYNDKDKLWYQYPINLKADRAILKFTCDPLIHVEPQKLESIHSFSLENFILIGDSWKNDALHLLGWGQGYVKNCAISQVKRAIVIETGWGKWTGVINTQCVGNPPADEGVLHIIPARFDNTNNILFIDCNFGTKSHNTEGYAIKWDDNKGHDSYFIDVNTWEYAGAGVYLNAKGGLRFIRCNLIKVYDYLDSANAYIDCHISGPTLICGAYHQWAIIDSCYFACRSTEGAIYVVGSIVSNSQFAGQTITGAVTISNCHFMPERDSQDFILKVYGGNNNIILSNILIRDINPATDTPIPCTHALEITTFTKHWTVLIEGLRIVCRKTKIGIKRYKEGSDTIKLSEPDKEPVIIRDACIKVNLDKDYDPSECYAIYTDDSLLVLENVIAVNSSLYNFANRFDTLKMKKVVYGPYPNGKRSENSGVVYVTGDGTTQTFTADIQHNLIIDKATVKITLDRDGTVDKVYLVDTDGDGFKETIRVQVTFTTAPADGEKVPIYWYAEIA